MYGNIFYFWA